MACFIVPATEAIVVTAVNKLTAKNEKSEVEHTSDVEKAEISDSSAISLHNKLTWLQNLLWGGSFLLAFEHVWHGEVIPMFPFLTAAKNPADLAHMLQEMATNGVAMAVLVTTVWGLMVYSANKIVRRTRALQK